MRNGPLKVLFCHFSFFNSFNFKIDIVKNIMKQLPILGQILEVLLKFEQTKFYDDEVFDSKLADCLLHVFKFVWQYLFFAHYHWNGEIRNIFLMNCAICYHLYNSKKVKNILPCNFTKSNTPPWVYFTFFKLYKWYQIAQRITCVMMTTTNLEIEAS